jgi:hypothetical protein
MARSKKNYSESILALGLSPGVSPIEIKEAYRKLAKQYHPDVYKLDDGEKFKAISSAYRFLKKHPYPPANSTQQKRYSPPHNNYTRRKREYFQEKRASQAQQKRELNSSMLKKVKPVVLVVLIFNLVLALDYLLPTLKEEKKINQVTNFYSKRVSWNRRRIIF